MADNYDLTSEDLLKIYNLRQGEAEELNKFKLRKLVSTVMLKLKDAALAGNRAIKFRDNLPHEAIKIIRDKGIKVVDKSDDLYNLYEISF